MADKNQGDRTSETEISVDMNAADPSKAVTRRAASDIGKGVRDDADADTGRPRTKSERELFKRMARLETNLTRQFSQREATREAEHQRQISELQSRLDKVQTDRGGDDAADAAHETAMKALQEKLAASYEKGDSSASAEITRQMSELDAKFWAKKAQAAGVATRDTAAAADKDKDKAAGAAAGGNRAGKGPTAAGSRFIAANEEWWDDPDYSVEQAGCNTIYLKLVEQEGFDPKSDETFREVAKQMKAKFPKLEVQPGRKAASDEDEDEDVDPNANDARQGEGRQRRTNAAAQRIDDRGDAGNRNRGSNRTLTAQEMETMKSCRLDPNNDRDVVQFLREATALEAAQA